VDWTVGGDLKTGKQIKKERKKALNIRPYYTIE
jgi:hypothetical protein